MGDGAAKRVGLSLAEQTFVLFLHGLAGRLLNDTHPSTRFEPCFLDLRKGSSPLRLNYVQ